MPHDPSKLDRNSIPPTPVKAKPDANGVDVAAATIYGNPLSHKSQVSPFNSFSSYSRFGSKEETFFDAQTFMDSDCDEDFYSVYGGTPSCGSTPVHGSAVGSPKNPTFSPQVMNRALLEGRRPSLSGPSPLSREGTPTNRTTSASPATKGNIADLNVQTTVSSQATTSSNSPSSTGRRKKLAELFRDSSVRDSRDEQANGGHIRVFSLSKSANTSPFITSRYLQASGSERIPNNASPYVKAEGGKKLPPKSASHCCFPRSGSSRSLRKTMTPPAPAIAVDA